MTVMITGAAGGLGRAFAMECAARGHDLLLTDLSADEIVALARQKNVTLISSPHHTFTTVRLLNLSTPIAHIMRRDVLTASPEDLLDQLRNKLAQQRTIPVLDEDGRVVGVVSRSDLINPVRHGVYLVDHNERSQTVDGLDEAELLGIVDHHRIADIQSAAPILFRNEIVGSTSTIIAGLYDEADIPVPPPIALSLIHISEPTRLLSISYAVFCLKKKNKHRNTHK